jgi:N-acetylated-alpha-linked acidic dipeptidase
MKSVAVILALCLGPAHGSLSAEEQAFISVPDPANARESLQYITSEPHVAGTDGDLKMATYVYNQMKEAGLTDVSFWNLTVGLNYPTDRPSLTMVDSTSGEVVFTAALSEDILPEDSTSDTMWRNHTFNGYAPSGDVTAPAVYANCKQFISF